MTNVWTTEEAMTKAQGVEAAFVRLIRNIAEVPQTSINSNIFPGVDGVRDPRAGAAQVPLTDPNVPLDLHVAVDELVSGIKTLELFLHYKALQKQQHLSNSDRFRNAIKERQKDIITVDALLEEQKKTLTALRERLARLYEEQEATGAGALEIQ